MLSSTVGELAIRFVVGGAIVSFFAVRKSYRLKLILHGVFAPNIYSSQ